MTDQEEANEVKFALLGQVQCSRCKEGKPKGEIRLDPRMENTFGEHKLCRLCYKEVMEAMWR